MFTGNKGKNSGAIYNTNVKGDNNKVEYGDTTTNALIRAENALSLVKDELYDDFRNLSCLIGSIEDLKPEVFWDVRRVNETEEMYQVRAGAEYQKFLNHLNVLISGSNFSKNVYQSFIRELAYFNDEAVHIKKIYYHFEQILYHIKRLVEKLSLITFKTSNNKKMIDMCQLYHCEEIAAAKMEILSGAAIFCLIIDLDEALSLSEALGLANIGINIEPGKAGYKAAMKMVLQYSKERTDSLAKQCKAYEEKRAVKREITDPLIIKLREKAQDLLTSKGLKASKKVMSDAEMKHLGLTELDMEETDPVKLFSKAQFSFFESDGEGCIFYFERSLKICDLPMRPRKFAELSLHRLKNPDIYEGNIGVMVYDILSSGSFEEAGIKFGDVIISVNEISVYEPMDVSSILGKSSKEPVIVKFIRDGNPFKVIVKSGRPAAAVLTQLIALNAFQI